MAAPGNACSKSKSETETPKMSHKKFRALLKKQKRKERRKAEAIKRLADGKGDQEAECNSDDIQENAEESILQEQERIRLHREWLEREERAQQEFIKKKEKEAAIRKYQEEQERRIREEWEERERREKEEQNKKAEKEKRIEDVLKSLSPGNDDDEDERPSHNPEAPAQMPGKQRENCSFYLKTGACRFGDRCSRYHPPTTISNTLMIPNMFSNFSMEQSIRDEYDTDISLEFDESDAYKDFILFYDDVLEEFQEVGEVIQFKVCCNWEQHLRGNVYVQYATEEECSKAINVFNGRFYAGRQLTCNYCPVLKWKSAICGLFARNRCPKGKHCNFLHVFQNPDGQFNNADRDFYRRDNRKNFSERRDRRDDFRNYDRHYRDSDDRWRSRRRGRSRDRDDYSRSRNFNSPEERDRHRHHRRRSTYRSRSRSREREFRDRKRLKRKDRDRSRSREGDRYYRRRERSLSRERDSNDDRRRRRSHSREDRSHSRERDRSDDKRRHRSHSREDRSHSRERDTSHSRERDRSHSRERDRSHSRERHGSHGREWVRHRSREGDRHHSREWDRGDSMERDRSLSRSESRSHSKERSKSIDRERSRSLSRESDRNVNEKHYTNERDIGRSEDTNDTKFNTDDNLRVNELRQSPDSHSRSTSQDRDGSLNKEDDNDRKDNSSHGDSRRKHKKKHKKHKHSHKHKKHSRRHVQESGDEKCSQTSMTDKYQGENENHFVELNAEMK
ncbi:U2 small nuclear ribonucleoprotein auxiliary factor 35 kDa subunit-related protein 2-like isoform X2 [Ptychodera flava]|uniref:U2 small nuclear ribonucleoprotein auxiliary factor 35 kDa subunit-related protein 2-like isoform X2 n=1 Tax=Ptychodera flava TaxID=63121 RepID=UPI00396A60F1